MPSDNSQIIKLALAEDFASRDITSLAVFSNGGGLKRGRLLAKEGLVLSGMDVAIQVFKAVSPKIKIKTFYKDGDAVKKGRVIATVEGFVSDLLRAERVVLNFLQQLSGVATLTRRFVVSIKPYRSRILDTRKTVPGLRYLQKKAVKDGGGDNHRMNLSDQYLIKDNHIDACGGIPEAVQAIKEHQKAIKGKKPLIEVETRNMKEVKAALEEGVDIILLDNMNLQQIRKAVAFVKGRCLLEVSGGVNLKNVYKIAATGVSRISIGALTHSAPAADISFLIDG